MRRERRQPTSREWEQITSLRQVVRRVLVRQENRTRWYSFHADMSELHAALWPSSTGRKRRSYWSRTIAKLCQWHRGEG